MQHIPSTFFHRDPGANKYDFGHVLIIGGSPGMVGAPFLAAQAALRTGAGLVTIASSSDAIDKLEKRVVEILTLRVPDESAAFARTITDFIRDRKVNALVVGPGQTPSFADMSIRLLDQLAPSIPVVVDGGAIGAFRGNLDALQALGAKNHGIVITPHAGEYEKLTGGRLASDAQTNIETAAHFARKHEVTLVLKGHNTLVAHRDGTIFRNTSGNPGMATAGAGDVLSGIIAGLLAQGMSPADAADNGVHLHGVAGDLAAATNTQPGMIASDILAQLPQAFKAASKEVD